MNDVILITVLVHYNNANECAKLVKQLADIDLDFSHKVIVVDNQSDEHEFIELKALLKNVECDIIQNVKNNGYGAGMNFGVKYGQKYKPKLIQMMNTDVEIINNDYIRKIVPILRTNLEIGVLGPGVKYKDGSIQNTLLPRINLKSALFYQKSIVKQSWITENPTAYTVEIVNGVCMFVQNYIFQQYKGFDEDYFMYCEEQDLCERIKHSGHEVAYWSGESVVHFEDYKETVKQISWRDILVRCNQVLFMHKRHRYLVALIMSLVFSALLIIKRLKGFKFVDYSLTNAVLYMFFPTIINRKLSE